MLRSKKKRKKLSSGALPAIALAPPADNPSDRQD